MDCSADVAEYAVDGFLHGDNSLGLYFDGLARSWRQAVALV